MPEIVLPNTWRDRLDSVLGRRRDLLLLLGVVVVSASAAVLLWSRGAPAQIAPPSRSTVAVDTGASPTPGAIVPPDSSTQSIFVHVAGAVRRPGLYEFPPGARVADAIDAARGARSPAGLNQINLAEPLVDGQKIHVLRPGAALPTTTATSGAPAPDSSGTTGALVNLNAADQIALESIPGVGPVTATAILDFRAQVGTFTSIDQLLDVSGIGPATLESIRPYVTL
ncbi:MAG: helix-hairpin-helix domain-containing protein [Actinomycetota bacterium]|nr:helix-hairpin-helix domain-containing protein [Actinomycetota bacterium]